MNKNFSRADIRKLIISEIKNISGPQVIKEELISLSAHGRTGPGAWPDSRLKELGRGLLSSDANEIARTWSEIMKRYVGPMATKVKSGSQNVNFILLDYIMGGWVPAPGNNSGSSLISYFPWVPYGPHTGWPFNPASLVREALDTAGDTALSSDSDNIANDSGELESSVTPDEPSPGVESGVIGVENKNSLSGYTVLPGLMMPWLSRRAREEILFINCLYDQGVTSKEAKEHGDGGHGCNKWAKRFGWRGALNSQWKDGIDILLPDILGGDIRNSGAVWSNPLISDGEAREKLLITIAQLVNNFLRTYGPWDSYYRYSLSDFEASSNTSGWGNASDPPTAVSAWMKKDSLFKNHAG